MPLDRRSFLIRGSAAIGAGAVAASCGAEERQPAARPAGNDGDNGRPELASGDDWDKVRAQFALSGDAIHMTAMLIASHPAPVRDAIEEHRKALDADPVTYLNGNNRRLQSAARAAAGDYLGVAADNIALTDSTTMGIGLVYNGLRLTPDAEILSTEADYYVTHESIRLASERTGARVRQIPLYGSIAEVSADEIVGRITDAIGPATRVLALTWVHSSTGLKLPMAEIAAAVADINADRDEDARLLVCLDGVHGFGVEDITFDDLGCDFFMAGCHKWLFGPRGTGIVAAGRQGWASVLPTIPSFIDDGAWDAWIADNDPAGPTTASAMTPGGFKPFEHQWAMSEAFAFQQEIGKERVAARTHDLARQLKEGLAAVPGMTVHTPMSEALSAGIVSFDIDGFGPGAVVRRLRERGIVASVAPYATPHARLTPSIRNTPAEIETVLEEVRGLIG